MFTYLFVPNNRQAFENKRVVDLALKSSIPGALLPILENFRRRFFWPNGPPLGLWECSQQCWMLQNDFKYKKNSQLLLKKFRRKSQTNAFKSFIYRQEKATTSAVRSLRAKTVIVCNSKWVKIIIFVLNNIYLTVLVQLKQSFASVSVASHVGSCCVRWHVAFDNRLEYKSTHDYL